MGTFEQVSIWNQKADKSPEEVGTEEYWKSLENQLERIQEEVDETREAIGNRDLKGVVDGGCDIDVTSAGLNYLVNGAQDQAMQAVLDNNDLKVTEDYCEAFDTQGVYQSKGLDCGIHEAEVEGKKWYSVHRMSDDKILKLLGHPKVDLSEFIPKVGG